MSVEPTPGALFARTFHTTPTHRADAPGRVNLLGEHIDYCGLPVLPMAIQRRVSVTFRPRGDRLIQMANVEPAFEPVSFRTQDHIVPDTAGHWGNYTRAATQALARRFGTLTGMDAVVSSDLPVAMGLASSSALVVATALALVHLNEIQVTRLELAELLAEGERYVGVRGGGMDQAIALTAEPDTARRIEFGPLATTPIPVPEGWGFVVASSLTHASKSERARDAYNDRTLSCTRALEAVAPRLASEVPPESYRELVRGWSVDELLEAGEEALSPDLLPRFRHVVTESARVDRGEEALRNGDLDHFGALLNDSHRSLRDDYEVSTPELDELVGLAREAGAAGARLTGAGFGGAILAVARQEKLSGVLSHLEEGFFRARDYTGSLNEHLFVAEASGGATVRGL